ncbi:MAG: hypothetical protein AAGJ35_02305, partial [Myxococcota bacterium]
RTPKRHSLASNPFLQTPKRHTLAPPFSYEHQNATPWPQHRPINKTYEPIQKNCSLLDDLLP